MDRGGEHPEGRRDSVQDLALRYSFGRVHAEAGRGAGGAGPVVASRVATLTSQVYELKVAMAALERECVAANAAQNEVEQSRQRLMAECQALCDDCASKLLLV
jgi:outer membrane murein-binding lipoprotein Lpp